MLRVRSQIQEQPAGCCFHTLTILDGSGSLGYGPSLSNRVPLNRGDSVLVPAGLQEYELLAGQNPLVAIKAYVPDLCQDIVVPLRERGISEATIVQLGGDPRRSDLAQYTHSH
jgi:hypothetical protein